VLPLIVPADFTEGLAGDEWAVEQPEVPELWGSGVVRVV